MMLPYGGDDYYMITSEACEGAVSSDGDSGGRETVG